MTPDELREALAALCHMQWAGWMTYLYAKSHVNDDGSVTIPAELVARWGRQMATPYRQLSAPEQDSDRHEADKFLALLEE
jgi:hypothetical protein